MKGVFQTQSQIFMLWFFLRFKRGLDERQLCFLQFPPALTFPDFKYFPYFSLCLFLDSKLFSTYFSLYFQTLDYSLKTLSSYSQIGAKSFVFNSPAKWKRFRYLQIGQEHSITCNTFWYGKYWASCRGIHCAEAWVLCMRQIKSQNLTATMKLTNYILQYWGEIERNMREIIYELLSSCHNTINNSWIIENAPNPITKFTLNTPTDVMLLGWYWMLGN